MSQNTSKPQSPAPPALPRVSSVLLLVLYFIVVPWSLLGPLLFTSGVENDMSLCLACRKPIESISASKLATERPPAGTHVLISDYSMTVHVYSSNGKSELQVNGVNVKPDPELPSERPASRISASLSRDTASNVVNSGNFVSPRIPALIPKNIALPPLDAIIVSSDESCIRVIETSTVSSYSKIIMRRVMACLSVAVSMFAIVAIVMLHRHRKMVFRRALVNSPF